MSSTTKVNSLGTGTEERWSSLSREPKWAAGDGVLQDCAAGWREPVVRLALLSPVGVSWSPCAD